MDQVKDILKQLIRYRFWIAVGISAILPAVAYVLGAGPIQTAAATEEGKIKSAADGVKKYAMGTPVNASYATLVQGKTEDLTKEVDVSWKKLYERQAPLLTWPERVQERFTTWGRKWPKEVDPSAVQFAILEYVNEYPKYVADVYKSFRPFDYVEGTGVVAAPPEQALLRPSPSMVEQPPPSLGKVWMAQERLWTQRTMLDVVATVNKDAKTWDSAPIKQILALEVGNKLAQDQRSVAKGEALVEAADVTDPNAPPPTTTSSAGGGAPGSSGGPTSGGDATAENPESIYYIGSPDGAYKILPVMLTVLIDQDHIQDLLVALENSPMTIQVRDFEMSRPLARVEKPKKGNAPASGYGGGGFMMPTSGSPLVGFGAPAASGGPTSAMPSAASYAAPGASGPSSGMEGGGAPIIQRKGVDARTKDPEKLRKQQLEDALKARGASFHDPYFNIVQVKVYGQARFFNHPPVAPAPPPSQAATETAAAPAASPDAAATAPATAEPKAEEKKAEEKKTDEPKAEQKKADEPKAEQKKAEEKKADEPKADEKKADETKADPAAPK